MFVLFSELTRFTKVKCVRGGGEWGGARVKESVSENKISKFILEQVNLLEPLGIAGTEMVPMPPLGEWTVDPEQPGVGGAGPNAAENPRISLTPEEVQSALGIRGRLVPGHPLIHQSEDTPIRGCSRPLYKKR